MDKLEIYQYDLYIYVLANMVGIDPTLIQWCR